MIWFIVAFLWMNIGIAWALHRGETDWDGIDQKIFVQIHMILWPFSMILNFGNDFYHWNRRRKLNKKVI